MIYRVERREPGKEAAVVWETRSLGTADATLLSMARKQAGVRLSIAWFNDREFEVYESAAVRDTIAWYALVEVPA